MISEALKSILNKYADERLEGYLEKEYKKSYEERFNINHENIIPTIKDFDLPNLDIFSLDDEEDNPKYDERKGWDYGDN